MSNELVLILAAAFSMFFSFAILKFKLEKDRKLDFTIDVVVFATMNYLFMGSMTGIAIAMVSSTLFSLYLLIFPPKFDRILESF